MKILLRICLLFFVVSSTQLLAEGKLGVILMHGKMGSASSSSPVGELADYLRGKDIIVLAPDMPWSGDREFDKSYEDSMLEIDGFVNKLKAEGATKIIVGGHSIGANAAIGYGSTRESLAGILAIAPGHIPEVGGYQRRIDHDYRRAQEMVDAGKGKEKSDFKDRNQGSSSEIEMTAEIYLSWFDPEGPAVMPENILELKPNTPIMWIIGEEDRMYNRGPDYAFSNAPEHPKNAYVVVEGGHKETPEYGQAKILNWLKSL